MYREFEMTPDGSTELAALLERSGVDFRREGDRFRFRFTSRGCKWQVICRGQRGRVLAYSIYPARVTAPEKAALLCARLNQRLTEGSFFVQEERIVFRTGCTLIEPLDAQERVARALEYSAAVMASFWERLADGAGDTGRSDAAPGTGNKIGTDH